MLLAYKAVSSLTQTIDTFALYDRLISAIDREIIIPWWRQ